MLSLCLVKLPLPSTVAQPTAVRVSREFRLVWRTFDSTADFPVFATCVLSRLNPFRAFHSHDSAASHLRSVVASYSYPSLAWSAWLYLAVRCAPAPRSVGATCL